MKQRFGHDMTQILGVVALVAMMLVVTPAMAQEESTADTGPNTGKVSFSLGFDVTTQYVFRGIAQEDSGLIFQPYADAAINLIDQENGLFKSLDFVFGTWNSLHSRQTGGTDQWYEADYYAGVSVGLTDALSMDVTFVVLDSPNNSGLTVFAEEIDVSFAYDDSALWGDKFDGLQPHFLIATEVDGGSDGQATNFDNGTYFEIGIAPSFTVVHSETAPITLTVPVTVGFGSNYYEVASATTGAVSDDTFGFADVGLDFSMPMTFVPSSYGSWEMHAGVHFLFLGNNAELINNGDGSEIIGTIGMSMSY